MKKQFFIKATNVALFVLLFMISTTTLSQAVISVNNMNILYHGIENPISVAVPGVAPEIIQISQSGAVLKKIDDINYLLTPKSQNMEVDINVFSVDRTDTIFYGRQLFKVKYIPTALLAIGGIRLENIHKIKREMFLSNDVLHCYLPEEFPYEIVHYTVKEYKIKLIYGDTTFVEKIQGNRLTSALKAQLLKSQNSVEIILSEIKLDGPNGSSILPVYRFDVE